MSFRSWLTGFLSNFTGGDNTNHATGEPANFANTVANVNDIINQSEREFALSSAKTAMDFEAQQAQLNREFQQSSANQAMQFEADQAAINRRWQEQMSNTAYQRAVKDLQAAGLNPMLAYTQGGAATTSGAMASGSSAAGSSAAGHKASVSGKNVIDIASQLIASTAKALLK